MGRIGIWLWAVIFAAVVALGCFRFSPSAVHTDIRALLPTSEKSASAEKILAHSTGASRDVWVLVGSVNLDKASQSVQRLTQSLARSNFTVQTPAQAFDIKALTRSLSPYRQGFLTTEDAAFLTQPSDAALLRRSLSLLYRPLAASFLPFQDDPLGTFEHALVQSALHTPLQFTGPCVSLREAIDGIHYCVVSVRTNESMSATGAMPLTQALQKAKSEIFAADPDVRMHCAGIALISEEAAAVASTEATFIGAVSALGILALVIVFFRRFSPIPVTLSILAASLVFACATVFAIFGEVHILTLVFGATLLGICVDYVFHMLCAVAAGLSGLQARAKLFKPLTLSLVTTGIGYAVMVLSPMPGLRQMAVFCISGLLSAYACVMTLAPLLNPAKPSHTARAFASAFSRLPRLKGKAKVLFVLTLLAVSAIGSLQLKTHNELKLLNRIPQSLVEEMQFVGKAVSPVSSGQLFVIEAESTEKVLRSAESLQKRLAELTARGVIGNAPNPTALLPSAQTQEKARVTLAAAQTRARKLAEQTLGQPLPETSEISSEPLTLAEFKRFAPHVLTQFWLSEKTLLVPLSGVTPQALPWLLAAAHDIDGVRFVNTTAEVAESLAHYRNSVFYALLGALAVIGLILATSLKKRFLDFWLPTLLSIVLTLGICGFAGLPFSLFTVLPLVLVVGLGVDYAIVLYSESDAVAACNSVFLAAASTLLAFGLLAFSSTPALHTFGLTLLIAMASVLVNTVLLRPKA